MSRLVLDEEVGARLDDRVPRGEAPDVHSSAEAYARRFSGPAGDYLLEVQEQAVRRLLTLPPGARILDIGGGHAQIAPPLARLGYRVTVLASEEAATRRLRWIAPRGVTVAIGPLEDPPFPPGSFDAAIALRMMPHVPDWRALVAGMTSVARRMAIVDYALLGSSNALAPLLFGVKKRFEGDTRRFAVMSRQEVRSAFAREGFRVDLEIGQFVLPMAAHRALRAPCLSRLLETGFGAVGLSGRIGNPVVARAVREAAVGEFDAHSGPGSTALL